MRQEPSQEQGASRRLDQIAGQAETVDWKQWNALTKAMQFISNQEAALGGGGGWDGREAGLDALPDRQGEEAGADPVQGGEVEAQLLAAFALGERFEVGLEGGGQLEAPFLIHRGRGVAAQSQHRIRLSKVVRGSRGVEGSGHKNPFRSTLCQ